MVQVNTPDYETILEQVTRDGGQEGRALVERAYALAQFAHNGQQRESGEPFFTHCLTVAGILSELNMDPATIAAAFLHDVVEDTQGTRKEISLAQLEQEFGPDVAQLVDGVTRLSRFDDLSQTELTIDTNVERLRKLFVALTRGEVRSALIKLADRLHNMRTLEYMPAERQSQIAHETMEIFAPLANLLGIWRMKWELEDMAFRHLEPDKHAEIVRKIAERKAYRDQHIARILKRIQERLEAEGIVAEVSGRAKHIYSIYHKMQRKKVPFEEIFDVRAARVIVGEVAQCYQVLGIIHNMWRPVSGEFDDYIATPKRNKYRSLHTAVLDEDGTVLEVQIRTREMHREAEYGVASHWKYKEGGRHNTIYEQEIAYLRSRIDWQRDDADNNLAETVRTNLFQDRVYVSTPKGDLLDLPAGSTPIDFAYHVHSEVGHRCRGAKVNGRIVSLDYKLKTGDKVQIITTKRGGPSRDWLNPHLEYTHTLRARAKIRQWFKRQDRGQNIAEGRTMLEREMKRLGIAEIRYDSLAKALECEDLDDFFANIGQGDINTNQLITKLIELHRAQQPSFPSLVPTPPVVQATDGTLVVHGTEGLLTNIARCCNPLPGSDIIGYVTRGRGVTIHRQDCANIMRVRERERLIDASWGPAESTYPVMIKITAFNRGGLVGDISAVVANHGISMSKLSSSTEKNIATLHATLQVSSIAQLSRVLAKIEQVRNVLEVRRVTG